MKIQAEFDSVTEMREFAEAVRKPIQVVDREPFPPPEAEPPTAAPDVPIPTRAPVGPEKKVPTETPPST